MDKKNLMIIGVVIVVIVVIVAGYLFKKKKEAEDEKADALSDQINQGATNPLGAATVGVKPDSSYDATMDVQRLLNAQSMWNDDEEAIYDVFRKLRTRSRLVTLRKEFLGNKGVDLETWLSNEVFNDDEMITLSKIINNLK